MRAGGCGLRALCLYDSVPAAPSVDTRACVQVDVDSGRVVRSVQLPRTHFGEGLTRTSSGSLLQLTWRSGTVFEYPDLATFHTGNFTLAAAAAASGAAPGAPAAVVQRHSGLQDGWGIAADGAGALVVTDSSDTLYWLDESSLSQQRSAVITFEGVPLAWVNELEWVEGEVRPL